MKSTLVVEQEAEQDIYAAYSWYEERQSGLGDYFLLCLDAAFALIQRTPGSFPILHRDLRRVLTKRFPYAVFYVVEPERVVVLAVLHMKRHPKVWKKRSSSK